MVDRNFSNYTPGRGVPPYLLSRGYDESSIDSDGASRIFLDTHSTITTEKDTESRTTSHIPHSFSSISMVSSYSTSSISSVSATNAFHHDLRSVTSSIYGDLSETSIAHSNSQSTFANTDSIPTSIRPINKIASPSTISFMDTSSMSSLLPNMSTHQYAKSGWNEEYNSDNSHGIQDMFPPYIRLFSDQEDGEIIFRQELNEQDEMHRNDEEKDDNDKESEPVLPPPDYDRCCLSGDRTVDKCGQTSKHHFGWPYNCITFEMLAEYDIRSYLKRTNVISKKDDDDTIMNERNLIANRLKLKNIVVDDSMFICPKHRSSFGIDWYEGKAKCHHPAHDQNHHPSASDCRRAKLNICSKVEGFPVGGRLCSQHRKLASLIPDDISLGQITTCSNITDGSQFIIDDSRDSMNFVLAQASLSPIRSQARKRLDLQSDSSLRRIASKLTGSIRVIQKKMAEALAPGQGDELLRISQLTSNAENVRAQDQVISDDLIHNLKKMYDVSIEQNMPFLEQVRLLSLLPRSWSYEKTMNTFGCSRHAIKVAHRMNDEENYILQREREPDIRQRADPEAIKHFVNWLVESNSLVSGTYGITTLRMDNGDKYEIPKQILQLQKSHILINYKKYCDETDFDGLGRTKLYDILNSITSAQQKIVSGLDEFVVEGVEAWRSLSNMVEGMPIPQSDRKRLVKQIDMAENYQKIRHSGHCSDNSTCITHCTTFALSDPHCPDHRSKCGHEHKSLCADCVNLIQTLDEIKQKIEKITDKETQSEAKFDFDNASEHIIEWSRHNLRAVQQDNAKTTIISHMGADEAFCTFDWGQKILPQEYRESQSKYFGKKGMSLLVGSFVWKDPSVSLVHTAATTTTASVPNFCTQSYILALTSASQTELDTLSAGEIILKQFKEDYPHVRKLHKRTDNAGNFSSHSTPEVEKLICERAGIELLTRDYSEVQKGKDICDRVCGVGKERMRSWEATGNNLLNAYDIKEGMEYAGGVKNTKVAVAEIISGAGSVGKTNVPNISSVRSIVYDKNSMKIFKASGIGTGRLIPYKKLDFESNMRVTSPFSTTISDQTTGAIPKKRADRKYRDLSLCPVSGCTTTFESSTELDVHIAANQHIILKEGHRTTNDTARVHLTEVLRSTSTQSRRETNIIHERQHTTSHNPSQSAHHESFFSLGWALRTRKLGNPMSEGVKDFIERTWLETMRTSSRITPEKLQEQIRTKRDSNGTKLFQTSQYPTINQIKYRIRKLGVKFDVNAKQQLIADIIDNNTQ